jgi:hypothetical protein
VESPQPIFVAFIKAALEKKKATHLIASATA